MKTPHQQAKEIYATFKRDETDTESLLRLVEFMSEYEGDDKMVFSDDLLESIKELENEKRFYTGHKKLDSITDGFRSNQVIVISAPPKAGKTQFCVHLAKSLPNPTMFLFEESPAEVLYKYYKKGLTLPRFITHKEIPELNIEGLYRKMIEAWAKFGSTIFFVDHLHFLLDGNDMGVEIKEIMQSLKKFAKRHNFTIFLVAHITKGHFEEPPGIDAIRDSSFIPQYADTVLMLWRETNKGGAKEHKNILAQTNNLLVNVALNRKINFTDNANTGLVDLTFNIKNWSYEDSSWYTEWIMDDEQKDNTTSKVYKNLRL